MRTFVVCKKSLIDSPNDKWYEQFKSGWTYDAAYNQEKKIYFIQSTMHGRGVYFKTQSTHGKVLIDVLRQFEDYFDIKSNR